MTLIIPHLSPQMGGITYPMHNNSPVLTEIILVLVLKSVAKGSAIPHKLRTYIYIWFSLITKRNLWNKFGLKCHSGAEKDKSDNKNNGTKAVDFLTETYFLSNTFMIEVESYTEEETKKQIERARCDDCVFKLLKQLHDCEFKLKDNNNKTKKEAILWTCY